MEDGQVPRQLGEGLLRVLERRLATPPLRYPAVRGQSAYKISFSVTNVAPMPPIGYGLRLQHRYQREL